LKKRKPLLGESLSGQLPVLGEKSEGRRTKGEPEENQVVGGSSLDDWRQG
jgi:hypothetical protein